MRFLRCLFIAVSLTGCTHTDALVTEPTANAQRDSVDFSQVTFGTNIDNGFQWTPNGNDILYHYVDSTLIGIGWAKHGQCFGIVPGSGGTRKWQYCESRGSEADSLLQFYAAGMSAGGKLAFMESVYRVPPPNTAPTSPIHSALWVTDSGNPGGHRRLITTFPIVIGDSVISWAQQLAWIDETHFIFAGARYTGGGTAIFPEPRMLVMVSLTETGATLQKISGTERAWIWTRATDGSILFLRGQWWDYEFDGQGHPFRSLMMDSVVVSVPVTGGTARVVANTPRRLGSLDCQAGVCLATDFDDACTIATCTRSSELHTIRCVGACSTSSRFFYRVDLSAGTFKAIPTGGQAPYAFPTSPKLRPGALEFAYLRGSLLYRAPTPPQ